MKIASAGNIIYYRNQFQDVPQHEKEIIRDCIFLLIKDLNFVYNSFYTGQGKFFMIEDFNTHWFKTKKDLIQFDIDFHKKIIQQLEAIEDYNE